MFVVFTRSTHAYDASCRSKRDARRRCEAFLVSCLVGVQRAIQNNSNVKSEPKYLAVKNLQYVLLLLNSLLGGQARGQYQSLYKNVHSRT